MNIPRPDEFGVLLDRVLEDLIVEVDRQDAVHPGGYPLTRDGIRMGLASLEDEVREVWHAWNDNKRTLWVRDAKARCHLREELMQVAAIACRMARSIEATALAPIPRPPLAFPARGGRFTCKMACPAHE